MCSAWEKDFTNKIFFLSGSLIQRLKTSKCNEIDPVNLENPAKAFLSNEEKRMVKQKCIFEKKIFFFFLFLKVERLRRFES